MTAVPYHPHGVADGRWKIEDVLQCAAVDHDRIVLLELGRNRHAEIVHHCGVFIFRRIYGIHMIGAEEA